MARRSRKNEKGSKERPDFLGSALVVEASIVEEGLRGKGRREDDSHSYHESERLQEEGATSGSMSPHYN